MKRKPSGRSPRRVRCAIYTRKSTEEGLDQEFNSLDAQREAALAFIQSQQHEGWVALAQHYDDGGFSGADMQRPALQRLLSDLEAGKVDCVVVYKVDRLSRCLLDFAKMMETFEKHQVSFVSVTQQFNTTHSMGRLTLHMLLSFAQFEREIISERTRDKVAATRRQGRWSGGAPPLGYDVVNTKLVVNDLEAHQVRETFALYLEHQALQPTVGELARRGWTTKRWTTRRGRACGGRSFAKGRLRHLLTNPLYAGKVRYQNEVHEGQHPRLVDVELFDAVQQQLQANRCRPAVQPYRRHHALLEGLLSCAGCGSPMAHTSTTKGSRRYRYYACSGRAGGAQPCSRPRLPCADIDQFVLHQLQDACHPAGIASLSSRQQRQFVERVAQRVQYDARSHQVVITLRHGREPIHRSVCFHAAAAAGPESSSSAAPTLPVSAPPRIPRVARLLALALRLERLVQEGEVVGYAELARLGHVTRARLSQITSLTLLAPDIQEALLFLTCSPQGRDPIRERDLRPLAAQPDWILQRRLWATLQARLGENVNAVVNSGGTPSQPARIDEICKSLGVFA